MYNRHSYGKDFSVRHTDPETGGQIYKTEHRHQFKHPIDMPHQRDLKDKRLNYEVDLSHQYEVSKGRIISKHLDGSFTSEKKCSKDNYSIFHSAT